LSGRLNAEDHVVNNVQLSVSLKVPILPNSEVEVEEHMPKVVEE
jgi:hypothetical protein